MVRALSRPTPPEHLSNVSLAGVRVDAVNGLTTAEMLRLLLRKPGPQHIITANIEYVRRAAADSTLRAIINSADVVVPDGMYVVWAARLNGAPVKHRITGHEIVELLAELSLDDGPSLFLLGAAPGTAEKAAAALRRNYPGVRIAGTYSPPFCPYPFPDEENRRILEAVNASGAGALLVALGCPKQDLWLRDNKHRLNISVAVGVGCVLDVLAGEAKRAPLWVQASGMEWLFRLAQEPIRLWPRYIRDIPFVLRLAYLGLRRRMRPGR